MSLESFKSVHRFVKKIQMSTTINLNVLRFCQRNFAMISKALILLACFTSVPALARIGGESGGGGDASELRVNEIRSDILQWIEKGGAKELKLPSNLSYDQYVSDMSEILQPKKVIISFTNDKVLVNNIEKTCRSFIARSSSLPNILCNISRFKNTTESEQYKLIHHEFAGLASIEKNQGGASDYEISTQITDFLDSEVVLKLKIKNDSSDVLNVDYGSLQSKNEVIDKIGITKKYFDQLVTNKLNSIAYKGDCGINVGDKIKFIKSTAARVIDEATEEFSYLDFSVEFDSVALYYSLIIIEGAAGDYDPLQEFSYECKP